MVGTTSNNWEKKMYFIEGIWKIYHMTCNSITWYSLMVIIQDYSSYTLYQYSNVENCIYRYSIKCILMNFYHMYFIIIVCLWWDTLQILFCVYTLYVILVRIFRFRWRGCSGVQDCVRYLQHLRSHTSKHLVKICICKQDHYTGLSVVKHWEICIYIYICKFSMVH